jgi:hypothetical protein
MNRHLASSFAVAALLTSPGVALGQAASVTVSVPVPSVRFEVAPAVVVVAPGIMVVPDYEEEVFLVDGWYWVRQNHRWYRARGYRGGWVLVDPVLVPVSLVKLTPGRYKHWKPAKAMRKQGAPHYAGAHGGSGKRGGNGKGKKH